jgi:hypothetical protein
MSGDDVPAPLLWNEPWARQAAIEADNIDEAMRVAVAAARGGQPDGVGGRTLSVASRDAARGRRWLVRRGPIRRRPRGVDRATAAAGSRVSQDAQHDGSMEATESAIKSLLAWSRQATTRRGWFPWWRGPLDRWRGTSIEQSYRSLHSARIFLVDLLPREDIDALIPSAIARVATCLEPGDIRRLDIDNLPNEARLDRKRAKLKQALAIGYDASDQLHSRVRGFRNILLGTGALIAVFMIILVSVVASSPTSMPLCFQPTITSPQPGQPETTRTVCPSGGSKPSPNDVRIVAGLGLIGGALAAAFSIRKMRGTSTPYDVPLALAVLKVPLGALTAVAGILLLGGGFVPGLSELDSQRQILAYALVFGYAQQLATRFIDDRAQSILQSVPSKDPRGKQPTPPAPQVPSPPSQPSEPPAKKTRLRRGR